MQEWQCRWSPTLGELEDTHQKIWGTDNYTDQDRPTVFFGIYGLPDFIALWRHKGEKHILWAGSDIRNLQNGYWLDKTGEIRLPSKKLAKWMNKYCTSWCENEVERLALEAEGIKANVAPSFLGDVSQFPICYVPGNKLYTSVSGDDFILYGWYFIPELARLNPDIEFHLYGNTKPPFDKPVPSNVIIHGRVPKEQMNAEIVQMQGALRLTRFDGFSEILAKSVLMGQYPISLIKYPHIASVSNNTMQTDDRTLLNSLDYYIRKEFGKTEPNLEAREFYIKSLNKYPWNRNLFVI